VLHNKLLATEKNC